MELGQNPWEYPPEAIVAGGIPAVRRYFEAIYMGGTTAVTRPLKVVIVGKETVGKTRYGDTTFSLFFGATFFMQCTMPSPWDGQIVVLSVLLGLSLIHI